RRNFGRSMAGSWTSTCSAPPARPGCRGGVRRKPGSRLVPVRAAARTAAAARTGALPLPVLLTVQGAFHGLLAVGEQFLAGAVVEVRGEGAILLPHGADFVGGLPEPDGQASRVGGTEGGGFRDDGPGDGHSQDVGLELHQQIVGD